MPVYTTVYASPGIVVPPLCATPSSPATVSPLSCPGIVALTPVTNNRDVQDSQKLSLSRVLTLGPVPRTFPYRARFSRTVYCEADDR
eukprot:6370750-Pyramimonas_sp.AAC.1